ncbi:QueT transporter family protein [Niallia circulans]|uniref:QueT transporter family protein n=1 Tax=Niallia circulans TaxID=1397 RepID=A0A553SG74_NIACI|nr:QueT transporter family protein [Niallia circulans]TRZ35987.1 QueT transporter family protein [Niallia circulans]
MKTKTLAVNGVIAALYIAVTVAIAPFGFTNVQFRLSEMFNHLVVFNKKYIYGIVAGVFLANLFFSPMVAYDLVFGVGQSIISLLITIVIGRYVKDIIKRMIINTIVFTFTMFIIAFELNLAFGLPFLFTWLTTAAGEFVVLAIGVPIIYFINKRVNFASLIEESNRTYSKE